MDVGGPEDMPETLDSIYSLPEDEACGSGCTLEMSTHVAPI